MEKFSYNSYPDSNDSSPRSREVEFDNPPPWEDQQSQQQQQQQQQASQSYKVKFMCSYAGKIHPRPHDNQLAYVGGETKILAVDRGIKLSVMLSKLSSLCADTDISFKYQLPGEDLDALISVTNDDDLEHMMHEYDRLYRVSAKPARMRLFLFMASTTGSFGSDSSKSDRDRFVEALNSGPTQSPAEKPPVAAPNNVDFLFGLEKGMAPPPVKVRDPVPEPVVAPIHPPPLQQEIHPTMVHDDRVMGSDHGVNPNDIQRQLHELQRLQIRDQEQQAMYRRKSDENLVGGYAEPAGYYGQKFQEKQQQPGALPVTVQQTIPAQAGFWQDNQMSGGGYPAKMTTTPAQQEQQVYMIPAPGAVYHGQPPPGMVRQVTGQAGQGYYTNVQRMAPDMYREQQMYNMLQQQTQAPPLSAAQQQQQQQQQPMGMVQQVRGGGGGGGAVGVTDGMYAQMAYDSGRQVYYTAAGGAVVVPPQYQQQGVGVAVSTETRQGGPGLNQDGKMINKA